MSITPNRNRATNALTAYRQRERKRLHYDFAVLGNNQGTVETADSGIIWVQLHGDPNQVTRALTSSTIPCEDGDAGTTVKVEKMKRYAGGVRYRVTGLASEIQPGDPRNTLVARHAEQHEYADFNTGGADVVNVHADAIIALRAQPQTVSNMTLYVSPGVYQKPDGTAGKYAGGNSPAFSTPALLERRCDLLYLASDGTTLTVLQGTPTIDGSQPTRPTNPGNCTPIVWVWLDSSITVLDSFECLESCRFLVGSSLSGVAAASHSVLSATHGDTLAAAVVAGDTIIGNATPEWVRLAAGTQHQLFKMGAALPAWSSFDWDEIAAAAGADMVHDHSSAAEGGTLPLGALPVGTAQYQILTTGASPFTAAWSAYFLQGTAGQTYTFPAVGGTISLGAGTLTVSTVNDATLAAHTHAITASSDPGSAASILKTTATGMTTLQTLGLPTTTSSVGRVQQNGQTIFHTYNNTANAYNIFIGMSSGNYTLAPTFDYGLVGIGYATLKSNTSGFACVAIGLNALQANTTGDNNVAIGSAALFSNVGGKENFALGANSFYLNVSGNDNVGLGLNAGYGIKTSSNIAIGSYALFGVSATTAALNTAIGQNSMYAIVSGSYNVGIGYQSLTNLTTGSDNTCVGTNAGYSLTIRSNATMIGSNAGYNNNAAGGIFIGAYAGFAETGANKLLIDSIYRATESAGRTQSIVYGIIAATPSAQTFTHNSVVNINPQFTAAGINTALTIDAQGSGANNDGGATIYSGKTSTTASQSMARLRWYWVDATHATRKAALVLSAWDTAERDALTIVADGVASITTIANAQAGTYTTTAVNLTLTTAHHWVKATAACTITLPTAVGCSGRWYIITATADNVIVDGNGGETINGETTQTLSTNDSIQIKSDGANWFII